MRNLKTCFIVTSVLLLLSCSAAQIETTRKVAKQASMAALPLIAKIGTAYGSPYASVIEAFTEAVVPDYEIIDQEEECYDGNDEDNEHEENNENCYEDDFEEDYDEDYDKDEGQDEYSDNEDDDSEVATLLAQVDVVREVNTNGNSSGVAIRNGDTLSADDNYKVQLGCNTECYAYIAQLDATGKMDPILPSNLVSIENPVPANTLISFPSDDTWFFLDNNTGVEQIYFIVSRTPREDIELIFKQLSRANKNLTQLKSVSVDKPMILTKGIGGVRKGKKQAVTLSNGQEGNYVSTLLRSVDAELVLTRWFNHI